MIFDIIDRMIRKCSYSVTGFILGSVIGVFLTNWFIQLINNTGIADSSILMLRNFSHAV